MLILNFFVHVCVGCVRSPFLVSESFTFRYFWSPRVPFLVSERVIFGLRNGLGKRNSCRCPIPRFRHSLCSHSLPSWGDTCHLGTHSPPPYNTFKPLILLSCSLTLLLDAPPRPVPSGVGGLTGLRPLPPTPEARMVRAGRRKWAR